MVRVTDRNIILITVYYYVENTYTRTVYMVESERALNVFVWILNNYVILFLNGSKKTIAPGVYLYIICRGFQDGFFLVNYYIIFFTYIQCTWLIAIRIFLLNIELKPTPNSRKFARLQDKNQGRSSSFSV